MKGFWKLNPKKSHISQEKQIENFFRNFHVLVQDSRSRYMLFILYELEHSWEIKDHIYRMVKVKVQQYLTKPNHCIWPIRTHYTFVSTNDYIYRILTAAAWYSSLQLLPSYIWSLEGAELSCSGIVCMLRIVKVW